MSVLSGATVLVTGANRGLGAALCRALLSRDVARVYGAARRPASIEDPRVVPVPLDLADPESITTLADRLADVGVLVNVAGILAGRPLLSAPDAEDAARADLEINFFGTLRMCRAFAPVVAAHRGGAIVNMLSVVSLLGNPANGSYAASKAAAWSLTNSMRVELRSAGTLVTGVYAGFIDTAMTAHLDVAKVSPDDVAAQICDGLERGDEEIFADERSRRVHAGLSGDLRTLYAPVEQAWAARG